MNRKLTTIRIAFDAVLAAMCAVLGSIASLDFGTFKFTFENFPVLIGALLFGPVDGMLIGGIGTFLSQMLKYGVELSTPLWIIPYVVSGLTAGLAAKMLKYNIKLYQMIIIVILNGVIVTLVNTVSLIIYNKYILGLPIEAVILKIPFRVLVSVIKSVVFAVVLPPVLKGIKTAADRIYPGGLDGSRRG